MYRTWYSLKHIRIHSYIMKKIGGKKGLRFVALVSIGFCYNHKHLLWGGCKHSLVISSRLAFAQSFLLSTLLVGNNKPCMMISVLHWIVRLMVGLMLTPQLFLNVMPHTKFDPFQHTCFTLIQSNMNLLNIWKWVSCRAHRYRSITACLARHVRLPLHQSHLFLSSTCSTE